MRRQDTIGRYAKYLVELQTPPVLTKFDWINRSLPAYE
jgi:hypothetical protein